LDVLDSYKAYLQLIIVPSPIRTLCNSVQHAQSLLSQLCLHWMLPGNGSCCRFLSFLVPRVWPPISQFNWAFPGYSFLIRTIHHVLTVQELHSLSTDSRLLLCPWPPSQSPGPPFSVAAGPRYMAWGRPCRRHLFMQLLCCSVT
jgi:hypothetical protein